MWTLARGRCSGRGRPQSWTPAVFGLSAVEGVSLGIFASATVERVNLLGEPDVRVTALFGDLFETVVRDVGIGGIDGLGSEMGALLEFVGLEFGDALLEWGPLAAPPRRVVSISMPRDSLYRSRATGRFKSADWLGLPTRSFA